MRLELVTLTGVKLDQEIYQATIPTLDGVISVFPDHEDLVAIAVPGVIVVRDRKDESDDKAEFFATVFPAATSCVRTMPESASKL